jgi:hypothetical protein
MAEWGYPSLCPWSLCPLVTLSRSLCPGHFVPWPLCPRSLCDRNEGRKRHEQSLVDIHVIHGLQLKTLYLLWEPVDYGRKGLPFTLSPVTLSRVTLSPGHFVPGHFATAMKGEKGKNNHWWISMSFLDYN